MSGLPAFFGGDGGIGGGDDIAATGGSRRLEELDAALDRESSDIGMLVVDEEADSSNDLTFGASVGDVSAAGLPAFFGGGPSASTAGAAIWAALEEEGLEDDVGGGAAGGLAPLGVADLEEDEVLLSHHLSSVFRMGMGDDDTPGPRGGVKVEEARAEQAAAAAAAAAAGSTAAPSPAAAAAAVSHAPVAAAPRHVAAAPAAAVVGGYARGPAASYAARPRLGGSLMKRSEVEFVMRKQMPQLLSQDALSDDFYFHRLRERRYRIAAPLPLVQSALDDGLDSRWAKSSKWGAQHSVLGRTQKNSIRAPRALLSLDSDADSGDKKRGGSKKGARRAPLPKGAVLKGKAAGGAEGKAAEGSGDDAAAARKDAAWALRKRVDHGMRLLLQLDDVLRLMQSPSAAAELGKKQKALQAQLQAALGLPSLERMDEPAFVALLQLVKGKKLILRALPLMDADVTQLTIGLLVKHLTAAMFPASSELARVEEHLAEGMLAALRARLPAATGMLTDLVHMMCSIPEDALQYQLETAGGARFVYGLINLGHACNLLADAAVAPFWQQLSAAYSKFVLSPEE